MEDEINSPARNVNIAACKKAMNSSSKLIAIILKAVTNPNGAQTARLEPM